MKALNFCGTSILTSVRLEIITVLLIVVFLLVLM